MRLKVGDQLPRQRRQNVAQRPRRAQGRLDGEVQQARFGGRAAAQQVGRDRGRRHGERRVRVEQAADQLLAKGGRQGPCVEQG